MSSEGQQPRMTVTAARTGADFEAGRGADRNGEAPVGIVPNDRREEQPATGLGGGGGPVGGARRTTRGGTGSVGADVCYVSNGRNSHICYVTYVTRNT